jgi:predicted protein tyrosine phosphatase
LNNRIHNCTNPYQGETKKVLCVCSAGLLRSPTAANVLHKEFRYNTRACGVHEDYALIPYDEVLGSWANEIIVMESWMVDYIDKEFDNKIIVLNIPDSYGYMDTNLQKMILDAYNLRALIKKYERKQ